MLIKNIILVFISITLSGCLSLSNKSQVVVIEKSTNQQNINQTRLSNKPVVIKKTKQIKKKLSNKSWSIPVPGKIIKTFSKSHTGLTFNTKPGQNVRAIRDGVVVYSGDKMKSYGKMIIIKHPLGFYSTYTQNQNLKVKYGDKIKKGEVIALTGHNNFYFEMKKFETPINPLKYMK